MTDRGESSTPPKKGVASAPRSLLTHEALRRAYENAQRALDRDAVILDQMRTRVSFLIALLAIGGTILGAILSNSAHPPAPRWIVLLLWLAIIPCIGVLWSTRDHGVLRATEDWRPSGSFGSSAPRGREERSFSGRWRELRRAGPQNQRLWKTGLGIGDMDEVPTSYYAKQELVYQVLVEQMYIAHYWNEHTLNRRGDLLRLASLLVLIFVLVFGGWLFISGPPSGAQVDHSSSTVTATATVTVTSSAASTVTTTATATATVTVTASPTPTAPTPTPTPTVSGNG